MMTKKETVRSLFTTYDEKETPSDDAIKVFLRLKPLTNDGDNLIEILDSRTILFKTTPNLVQSKKKLSTSKFTFSRIFKAEVTQERIFSGCVSNHVKDLFAGQHCLLFTYGTTNAGKTFTVLGTGDHPGIIPRTLSTVFKSIEGKQYGNARVRPDMFNSALGVCDETLKEQLELKQWILNWKPEKNHSDPSQLSKSQATVQSSTSGMIGASVFKKMQSRLTNGTMKVDYEADEQDRFSVWISFAEIYNEAIFDLLQPVSANCKRRQLKLAHDSRRNCYIKGLRHVFVQSEEEAYKVLMFGKNNLQVAATASNASSSRSHCVFSVKLMKCANVESPERAVVSSFSICDLAGAERQKKTLNVGQRLKESQNINCSLYVLHRCFSTIRKNQLYNENTLIPFRDSKLTQLFQHALLGRESVTMIVNVNSEHHLCEETHHVLKASAIAKHIVVQPRIKQRPPRPTRTSRFSHFVRHNRNSQFCWDTCVDLKADEDQASSVVNETASIDNDSKRKGDQIENLLALVESLKLSVKEEKLKNIETKNSCRIREHAFREEMRKELSDKLQQAKTESELECTPAQELTVAARSNSEEMINTEAHTRPKRRRTDTETVEEEESLALKDLREEISMQNKQIDALTELVNTLRDEKNDLTMHLTRTTIKLSGRDEDIQNLKRTIKMFADETELKARYTALEKEMEEKIKGRDRLLDEASNDLQEESQIREELECDVKRLEKELEDKEEENLKLHGEVEDLQQEIISKTNCMDMLANEIDEIETECNDKVKNLELQLSESNEEVEKLRQQLIKNSSEEISLLEQSLKRQIQETISVEETLKDKLKEINHLSEELAKAKTSIGELKHNLRQVDHDLECTQNKIIGYESSIPTLQAEFHRQQKETSEYKKRCDDQLEVIINMEKEASSFKTNQKEIIGKYEDMLKKSKDENETLKKEVARVANVLYKSTPTPKKELENQIEDLKKKLEETQNTCLKLKLEKEAVQNQVRFYSDDEKDKENENVYETERCVSKSERRTQATRNRTEVLSAIQTRTRSVTSCKTRVMASSRRSRSATKTLPRRTRAQIVPPVTVSDFDEETKPVDKPHRQICKKLWDNETKSTFGSVEVDLDIPQDSPRTKDKRRLRKRNQY